MSSDRDLYVLYLDYDGVLHPEAVYWHPQRGAYLVGFDRHELFEHVPLLEELLAPHPTVKIVLSTSWVRRYHFSKCAQRLGPALRARTIGATYHTDMDREMFELLPRGRQVLADVDRRRPARWLALDDSDEGWDGVRSHIVHTHPVLGIAEPTLRATLDTRFRLMFG